VLEQLELQHDAEGDAELVTVHDQDRSVADLLTQPGGGALDI
jgi:hypothetical protein